VELIRPDGKVGTLRQPGQPERRVPLKRRPVRECLAEELRRLDPDEIYQASLAALLEVDGRRTGGTRTSRSSEPRNGS
jgi:glucose-6-phosphate dehydrogenase assembly protein OpcA